MLTPPYPRHQLLWIHHASNACFTDWNKKRAKGLSRSSWLALMTATVIGVDSEASMMALYHHAAASTNLEDSIAIAELMRETGLRGIAVVCVCTDASSLG